MSKEVPVPPLPPSALRSSYAKASFVTELAFNTLITEAIRSGLPITRPMGLMYLPEQSQTREFQEACRTILRALLPPNVSIDTNPD